jgi:hypothetical protein
VGIKATLRFAEADRALAEVTCEFALDYEVSDEALLESLRDEDFNAFARITGMYNAWPYLREFLQSITSRMPLPAPILLPTLAPAMLRTPSTGTSDLDGDEEAMGGTT